MEYLVLTLIIVIILFGVFVTFFAAGKRKKLPAGRVAYYQGEISKCANLSPSERIMHYDKILHHILRDYGYAGMVGDQLKAKPAVIIDLNAVWELHKLRNRLAHEMEAQSDGLLERKSKEFERVLQNLLK